jgi:Ca2+-transporting ATPase
MKDLKSKDEQWHRLSVEEVLHRLRSTDKGLSSAEASKRLAIDGPNELKEAKQFSPLRIFFDQFKSLVIWILIVAGIVSGVMGEAINAGAILAVVVLNAFIGFYQEFSAEKSIAALKEMTAPLAKVRRDGKVVSIAASKIVTGDIVSLEAGDLVASDARLLYAASLRCNESALTGESEAVSKNTEILEQGKVSLGDRQNMVFMGTSVAYGTGLAVVVNTAMHTELGRIASLIESQNLGQRTPLEKKLESFGQVLVWTALGIVTLLFGLGMLRGTPLLELFMTSISLAVAAVPEGLPTVVTVALALGVRRMATRRTLVRKLSAVETLGSTSVICTDKTGTLTIGEMTVRALFVDGNNYEVTGEGYGPTGDIRFLSKQVIEPQVSSLRELTTNLIACNNAHLVEEKGKWKTLGDPTEGALLAVAVKAGGDRERIEKELPKQYEIPFDSDRKRSTVVRKMLNGNSRAFINGAPEVLLELCSSIYTSSGIRTLSDEDRMKIVEQNGKMAKKALRVLGSAYRDLDQTSANALNAEAIEHDLVFVGLSGMYDPPRKEAQEAVAKCHAAGIRVVMITGDHPQTATAIAREIGITSNEDNSVSGVDLDKLDDAQLRKRVLKANVYARVTAEHKLRIVQALKADGEVVAMTGDGVNDAPAIKGADIGIAMGKTGTEVTKQAADMIITDDDFATIVAAVEEGRGIYDNIRKTLQYLLAGSTAELLIMAVCVVIGLPSPLLPIHLLWINLVTDGLPALCLATDSIDPDVMKRAPRDRSELITNRSFLRTMLLTGFLTAAVTFAVYYHTLQTGSLEKARGAAFAVLVFAELLRAFGARSESKPIWRISLLTNLNLTLVVALSFALQMASQHIGALQKVLMTSTMSFVAYFILLAIATIPLLSLELIKVIRSAARKSR